ncbi:hypothetical protein H4R19_000864 [Coemansia spiralis]|nr:hypothetical protein H4R19_000864 [Coemansia spiralis]
MPVKASSARAGDELPRVLVVDNYDSYTFNLVQLLMQQIRQHYGAVDSSVVRQKLLVIRNDQYPWAAVRDCILPHVDCVVISPGPGSPERAADFGVCSELIRTTENRPLLGVCLGHQGIAHEFGAKIVRCAAPVHGQISPVEVYRDESGRPGLLDGIGSGFRAVRYHSLAVSDDEFPHGELQILARATGAIHAFSDGSRGQVATSEIMALRHRTRPLFGVQFHPESICSEQGARIMANFISTAHARAPCIPSDVAAMSVLALDDRVWRGPATAPQQKQPRFTLVHESVDLDLPGMAPAELGDRLQVLLHGGDPMPLWLDSAKSDTRDGALSVMASGCDMLAVRYRLAGRHVSVARHSVTADGTCVAEPVYAAQLPAADRQGNPVSFWTWMQGIYDQTLVAPAGGAGDLRFQCGWIGYFGYEMKDECFGMAAPQQQHPYLDPEHRLPDAQLTFVDRCVVLDLGCSPPRATALALVAGPPGGQLSAEHGWLAGLGFSNRQLAAAWTQEQVGRIRAWAAAAPDMRLPSPPDAKALRLRPVLSRGEYLEAIAQAKQQIERGESYEICLTNQFRATLDSSRAIATAQQMRQRYMAMRRSSPAPYGALLWYDDLAAGIASCSPERFLSIAPDAEGARWVEMKPIKGTARRAPPPASGQCTTHRHGNGGSVCAACHEQWVADDARRAHELRTDVKERAENLMIVDLVRHDLNSVSDGSVAVPRLMHIESFAAVHQLVSTIRARVRPQAGNLAVLAHCFPPGSMTGAPKRRTLRILDRLERTAEEGPVLRGVYSGAIGYLSAHGAADFSVVIRTAVVDARGSRLSVGAGGALTILSDPKAEWAEVEAKLHSIFPLHDGM